MYIKAGHADIIFSEDGKLLYCLQQGGLVIRDSQTLKVLHKDQAVKHPNYCEYDRARARLFIHNTIGKIGLFDLKQCQYTHFYHSEEDDGCNNVIIHEGRHLLDVSWAGIFSYFDVESGERTILHVFDKNTEFPHEIFSYDNNNYIILVGGKLDYPIKIATLSEPIDKNQVVLNTLQQNNIEGLIKIGAFNDYSNTNKLFTFCSFNRYTKKNTIYVSSLIEIKYALAIDERVCGANASLWSKDGKYIIAFGNRDIYIVDFETMEILKHSEVNKMIYRIMFSPDGKYIFFHYWNDSEILLWEEYLANCLRS